MVKSVPATTPINQVNFTTASSKAIVTKKATEDIIFPLCKHYHNINRYSLLQNDENQNEDIV
jgi:hypothetical protein